MQTPRFGVRLLGILVAYGGLGGASAVALGQTSDVLAEVRRGWSTAYMELDAAGVAAYFAHDARIFHPGRPTIAGSEEILAYFRERTSGRPFTITFVEPRSWASGDLAVDESAYEVQYTDDDGVSRTRTGRYVMVYKKADDGRWVVTHDIWNADSSNE